MRRCLGVWLFLCLFASAAAAQSGPRVFALDAGKLVRVKAAIARKEAAYDAPLARLRRQATEALRLGPFTVTAKTRVPPSGDKHDFLSLAPYWWPDPAKPDGLPYIRRDGEVNPESKRDTDNPTLNAMVSTVETLSLAWYYTGEEPYAARAALLLRTWFIDKGTKMNPNYNYAQAVMGRNDGRAAGLIDARGFIRIVDSVGLLAGSRAWTAADEQALQAWYRAFVSWLQTSPHGRGEAEARNNHGAWFAADLAVFALFLGDDALARRTIEGVKARIAWQIEPDGRQPLELSRTRGVSYSLFNLDALLTTAVLGEKLGIDLWNYQTKDGRSIGRALAFLAPFAFDRKPWPYQQIISWEPEDYFRLLRRADGKFRDEALRALVARAPAVPPAHLSRLW